MIDWFFQTLKSYPEIAIFISLALGYYFGSFTYKGLGLGAVTATLIAAVIIAQDGLPQALFAAIVCGFCLIAPVVVAKVAGYDIGSAAGLYAGSQTISAS